MATVRDIKRKMRSIKNISQITKAVQMVAASKMIRAQEQALQGQPYSQIMQNMLKNLAGRTDSSFHPLLKQKIDIAKKTCILFITPNKGLCGSLPSELNKIVMKTIDKEKDIHFLLIGKKGENILLKLKQKIIANFPDMPNQPLFAETIPISKIIIDGFVKEKFKKVLIIYPHFVNTLIQEVKTKQILPIEKDFEGKKGGDYVLFEPDPKSILDRLVPFYIELSIYHFILESIASEHSARMNAMKNATDNSLEILDDLTLTYNQARQIAITQELANISNARKIMQKQL